MRLVRAAKASPHAKYYNLGTAWNFGKTPTDWQTGVIIPIFKKGDSKQCTNY